jgi:hypothetical protein
MQYFAELVAELLECEQDERRVRYSVFSSQHTACVGRVTKRRSRAATPTNDRAVNSQSGYEASRCRSSQVAVRRLQRARSACSSHDAQPNAASVESQLVEASVRGRLAARSPQLEVTARGSNLPTGHVVAIVSQFMDTHTDLAAHLASPHPFANNLCSNPRATRFGRACGNCTAL